VACRASSRTARSPAHVTGGRPEPPSREGARQAAYSAGVASPGSAVETPNVSAILLDAGGVLVFPEPSRILPTLHAAGLDPDQATLERAHYQAMAAQDTEPLPPVAATWWHNYLVTYVAACGVAQDRAELLAAEISQGVRGRSWAHAGLGVIDGLRALAALGLPLGVVSNSDGTVEADLRQVGICYVPGRPGPVAAGVEMGIILDSAVVGVAKPDPGIFHLALDALNVPAGGDVLHVGDSLRYDVAGALAAGIQPVHMDPYGFCPAPGGHPHVPSLAALAGLISARRLPPRHR
jgi:putative hydrolase of the HAD superfamily